jgi:Domain of unknown function (DUF4382)
MKNFRIVKTWPYILNQARSWLLLIGAAALTACGSGGGSSGMSSANTASGGTSMSTACSGCGGAIVTLTDAPGDFVNYIVNVVSLQLTRSDGTVVQTVPVTTKVDFAQLVNLSEIVSTSQIPGGKYVSATITLDYSAATIVVDNGSGGVTIAANSIINGGTSLPLSAPNPTQMTLTLSLPSNAPLLVTPGTVAHLALDFNLVASNSIAPSATSPASVTVHPVLTGSLVPDATRQVRVRGGLVSTNTGGSSFVINVRPFDNDSGNNGQFTVLTTATTTYAINGTSYTGPAGLTQLAGLAAGSMAAAYGSLDIGAKTFTAGSVLAGSSVAGTRLDSLTGTVVSRTGNVLTIGNGVELQADHDDMSYRQQVTATIGSATAVSEPGQIGSFTIQDISVGQRVQIAGTFSTGTGSPTMDATAGSALLLPTSLTGTVTAAGNPVTVNLQSLGGQPAANLVFAGTGSTSAQDASAASYTVALPASLAATAPSAGAPVSFTGFVTPFGLAPPDFTATTFVNFANTNAELDVRWPLTGVTTPFATLTSSALSISHATLASSVEHVIRIGFTRADPSTLSAGLQLVPDMSAANPRFAIGHALSWKAESFTTFVDFVTALTADLNGTTSALALEAVGPYNGTTGSLSVQQMVVILNN